MRFFVIILSFIVISCGKNSIAPNPALLQNEVAPLDVQQSQMTAILSFNAIKGGAVHVDTIALDSMDLEDAQEFRAQKQGLGEFKRQSNVFVFFAKDLEKRLDVAQKFSNADMTKAEIIIETAGAISGQWGWVNEHGATTWKEKIKKGHKEKLVIKIEDKDLMIKILRHSSLLALNINEESMEMAQDKFSPFKIHPLKLKQTHEFDQSFEIKNDDFALLKTYQVEFQARVYPLSLRFKKCVWSDNGDVGGRRNKDMRCHEERCEVQMQQVVEVKREEVSQQNVISFDQEVLKEGNWLYAYSGDSMRLKENFDTQVVNVGLINQGNCAGKEMIDALPGTSQKNIAPRKIVQLKSYLLL